MFGKLSLDDIPYEQPILVVTAIAIALGGLALFGGLTYTKRWKWLPCKVAVTIQVK